MRFPKKVSLGVMPKVVVGLAVPGRVEGGVGEAEVGGQVDDGTDPVLQLGNVVLRRPVGQGEEDRVQPLGLGRVVGVEHEVRVGGAEARVQVTDTGAGLGVAGGPLDRQLGVSVGEPKQFGPGVPGRPDDADAEHRRNIRDLE